MENDLNKSSDKIERMVWEIPTIEVLNFKYTLNGSSPGELEDSVYTPQSPG